MPPVTLSIIVPVYNEAGLIAGVLDRILTAPASYLVERNICREIILVDDGSRDNSAAVIHQYVEVDGGHHAIRLLRHIRNRGKGAAIRTALAAASGEFCIIQDADFEYDPGEYSKLLEPLLADEADIVFGSRFSAAGAHHVSRFWHSTANRVLTSLCGMAADLRLTDALTCFKAFRTVIAQSIPLRSEKFGIEAELTIKFAKRRARFCEVPITYRPRTRAEGKKIRAKDALGILGAICRSWIFRDLYVDKAAAMLGAMEHAPRFNRWMAGTLKPFLGDRVLEIGAGIGNLTRLLCANQPCYVVSDIDPYHLVQLRSQLRLRTNVSVVACNLGNSEDFDRFSGSMDAAICINVLEHIEDDLRGLRNLHSALAPGGRAIVLVPQGENVYGTMDETLGHYRRYSKAALESQMRLAGFHVERIIEFNRVTYPGWFLNGRILRRRRVSRVQLWLFDLLVPLWKRVDPYLPWPPTSLIAIGTRGDYHSEE
ncbi:MAG TPA: glycosyltransferase [Bryobacteraceae bacterium]|jgi:SAM-dependent methyltransferase|nr:glycosyltransferase [Bryobacteraceae bacterium]